MTRPLPSLALLAALALTACGADVKPYEPSIAGILNEGVDPDAPPQDVSFVEGQRTTRVSGSTCGEGYTMLVATVLVSNEYRQRTVSLRKVDDSCVETPLVDVPPGEQPEVSLTARHVLRVYDAADNTLLSSWQVGLNSLGTDRIVLRSSSPDI